MNSSPVRLWEEFTSSGTGAIYTFFASPLGGEGNLSFWSWPLLSGSSSQPIASKDEAGSRSLRRIVASIETLPGSMGCGLLEMQVILKLNGE